MLRVASFHLVVGLFFLLVTAKPQQELPLNQEISEESSSLENSLDLQLNENQSPSLHDLQSGSHPDAEDNELSNQIPISKVQNTETSSSDAINANLVDKNASSTEEPAIGNELLNNDLAINIAIENGSSLKEAISRNELAEPSALNLISLDQVHPDSSIITAHKPAEHLNQDIPKIQQFFVDPVGGSSPVKEIQPTASHSNAGSTSVPLLVANHQNPTKDANSISSDNNPMELESNYLVTPYSKRNLRRTGGEDLNMKSLLNILGIIPPKPEAPLVSVSSGVSNFQIMNFKEDPKLQAISELLLATNSEDNREELLN